MGELKPIGSEKLNGDEKIKRILELTYYQRPNNSVKTSRSSELIKESSNGSVFGIVKEKDGYYVKKGLNEGTLDYIGGMFMKNKNRFSSYSEALKRLELIKGQEELHEATKYVLKQNKPTPPPPPQQSEAPAPQVPMPEPPPPVPTDLPPAPDAGMEDEVPLPPDENAMPDAGMGQGEDDHLKIIQKLSGRLGQRLREFQEKLESKDIKYVINMVLSAVDLDKLEDGDKEEILAEFDDEEQYGDMETPSDDMGADDYSGEPQSEDELDETMDTLENLINTPWEDDEDVPGNEEAYGDDETNEWTPEDVYGDDELPSEENPGNLNDYDDLSFLDDESYMDDSPEKYTSKKKPLRKFRDEPESDVDENNVRELDIDELTNMINSNIKQTLGKYFTK